VNATREDFQKALTALFDLEEKIGPYGDPVRQTVYNLRWRLGIIASQSLPKDGFAIPAAVEGGEND
jgi:hypothetical protein